MTKRKEEKKSNESAKSQGTNSGLLRISKSSAQNPSAMKLCQNPSLCLESSDIL